MKFVRAAIDNYQFTLVIFTLLTIGGMISFFTMPRSENPVVYIPGGSVVVIYPGASPADMEQLIAVPIESAINELDDILKIHSTVLDGIATISVEFSYDTDADDKFSEIVRQVNSVRNELPEDIYDIIMFQFSSSDVAAIQLAFVSDSAGYSVMRTKAETLEKELSKINGVKKVDILACPKEEVRISLDFEEMAALGISLDMVGKAIMSNNANIPGGNIDLSGKAFSIKTSGPYKSLEEIRNTVVHSYMGRLIYLKNIADVRFEYRDQLYKARFNGERAIFMTVSLKDGFNVFDVTDRIAPELEKFSSGLTNDISLETVFSQSELVDRRISGFLANLFQGIFLVGLVVFLTLGYRSAIIVIIAIPLSIIIGLFAVDSYGLGLEQITIAGLVVALGLLVDNSIVIIENISRFRKMGFDSREAAIRGTAQITGPIISSTITTLFSFIPIIMMPDKAGDFIRGLPVTIIATLTVSLLIALTLSPLIASFIFRKYSTSANTSEKKSRVTVFAEGPYHRILSWSLNNKLKVIGIIILILTGSAILFLTKVGISFFPSSETPQFLVRITLPEGANLHETEKAALFAEKVLDTIPLVRHYATNIGHGNPRVYYNVFAKTFSRNYADIYVSLKDYNPNEFNALVENLRKRFSEISSARYSIKIFEQGVPIDAPIMIYVNGENLDSLNRLASKVENILMETKGTINVENQLSKTKTDLYVDINKEKANLFGVPVHEIDKTVRAAMSGLPVSKYRSEKGEEYEIVLRMEADQDEGIEAFDKVYVSALTGKMIPLSQLASLKFKKAPGIIKHRNMDRVALITADVDRGYNLDQIMNTVIPKLDDFKLKNGYGYYIAGELEARSETFGGMGTALIMAIIAIFSVLVLQFRSFRQPLIIFLSFVLGFIGVSFALYFSGYSFSFTAFIGFISLSGIVVNNAIILIDYTNSLRKEGKTIGEALIEAGETRFLPILLTTVTTIGGLLPLTLGGGDMWAPLGWTIIGGLLVSTALTLIVVPVFYQIFEKEAEPKDQFLT